MILLLNMSNLLNVFPVEICEEIFSYVPIVSLYFLSITSKSYADYLTRYCALKISDLKTDIQYMVKEGALELLVRIKNIKPYQTLSK